MNRRVTVGRIGRPHGLTVLPDTDSPDRFSPGSVFVTDERSPRRLEVGSSRYHQGKLLVVFLGVSTRQEAESLRQIGLTIAATERRALGADEFWPDELIGLSVRDSHGRAIGKIADIEAGGPQDRLVVLTADARQVSVPFVRDLVPEVRIAEGFVVVHPIEGLLNPPPD